MGFTGEADIAGDEDEKEREKEGRKRGRLSADKDVGFDSSKFGMGEVTRNLRNIAALSKTIGTSHVYRSGQYNFYGHDTRNATVTFCAL